MRFELLTNETPGDLGFKLTGEATDGGGQVRVWLRRVASWNRYLDPRVPQGVWDVKGYTFVGDAFAAIPDFTIAALAELTDGYAFPQNLDGLAKLLPVGDEIYDTTVKWAQDVTASKPTAIGRIPEVSGEEQVAGWDEAMDVAIRASGDFPAVPSDD